MEQVLALPYTFKEWVARQQAREAAGGLDEVLDFLAFLPPGGNAKTTPEPLGLMIDMSSFRHRSSTVSSLVSS